MSNDIDKIVQEEVRKLRVDFKANPHLLLTEDDMRMHLCALLLPHFREHEKTEDDQYSISLHSEVRWYGKGKLKYRSDIVIIDVRTLIVKSGANFNLPSKGYGFNTPKAIIELKFRRPNGCSDNEFLKSIQADCLKLKKIRFELQQYVRNTYFCIIAFDKKRRIQTPISSSQIRIDYEFSSGE